MQLAAKQWRVRWQVRLIVPCGLFLLLLVSLPSAFTQTQLSEVHPQSLLSPVATISSKVDEVDLAFTVTDKRGHFVGNLRQNDFALLDNNSAPERLTFFQQRSDLPLHLAILIDTSDSVKCRLKFEQAAARAFIRRILRPGTDRVFVVAFSNRVSTVQELTDKSSKVSRALKHLTSGGDTALYDAVIYASEKLRQYPEKQLTRRAIVVLSDGVDTVKRSTLEQAKEAAARAEATIFSVSTNMPEFGMNPEGDVALKSLAQGSGGMFLQGGDEDRVGSAFHDVERALRNQYVLAYNPADFRADGSYHVVEVVPHKHGLQTNCRKGYYAMVRAIRSPATGFNWGVNSLLDALH